MLPMTVTGFTMSETRWAVCSKRIGGFDEMAAAQASTRASDQARDLQEPIAPATGIRTEVTVTQADVFFS